MRRVLLALFCLASLTASFASTSFSKSTYPTGNSPSFTVSADINRDGHPDLITSDSNGFITVLLGSGSSFSISGNYATANTPSQLAAGDFNNDGYPDVVVLEDTGYQLFLSAHNGALIPQNEILFPSDMAGQNLIAVDLNRDHAPDIAFTLCPRTFGNCSLNTVLSDRAGHFQFASYYSLGGHGGYNTLISADFDRDGIDDIGVAIDSTFKTFHSYGNGGLTPLQSITSPDGKPIFSAVAGEIDAKNGPDLVIAAAPSCFPDCNSPAPIYVYLNGGTGKLNLKDSLISNSNSTNEVKLVDLTGDNRLDIVLLNGDLQGSNGSLSWAQYAGSGTYGSFSTITQLGMPMHMTTRDVNLDSRHDIALTDSGFGDYNVSPGTVVLKNTGSGAYCSPGPSSATLTAQLCYIAHTGDTFTFEALGNSPTGVRRMELWVDGKKKYNSPDDRLKYKTTLASGSHKVEFVAVDAFGASAKLTEYVTAP